ncbi:MAG: transposase [Bacteroidota bacterium]
MKERGRIYSDQVKLEVAQGIVEKTLTWKQAQIKYGIKSPGSIGRWVEQYKQGYFVVSPPMKEAETLSYEALLHQVRNLKKQIRQREIQVYALGKIIDITEQDLQIDIRKKYGTGQLNMSKTDIQK